MLDQVIQSYEASDAKKLGIQLITELPKSNQEIRHKIESGRKSGDCFICFPHEWQQRSEQIFSHIKSYKDDNLKRIFARQCEVKPLDISDVRKFCDLYHIQGSNRLGIAGWGIYYQESLLGVLSLGRHHYKSGEIVLDRLCFLSNIRIVGGASKLFSAAVKWAMEQNDIYQIISFSDNRWSLGIVYERLNFKFDKLLPPSYL